MGEGFYCLLNFLAKFMSYTDRLRPDRPVARIQGPRCERQHRVQFAVLRSSCEARLQASPGTSGSRSGHLPRVFSNLKPPCHEDALCWDVSLPSAGRQSEQNPADVGAEMVASSDEDHDHDIASG